MNNHVGSQIPDLFLGTPQVYAIKRMNTSNGSLFTKQTLLVHVYLTRLSSSEKLKYDLNVFCLKGEVIE